MPDLSVLIPARQEEFLARTVEDVLANARADTEVIVVLDGEWPNPPLPQHPKVTVVYLPESIGQRAATNLAARLSTARYVMKLDAHASMAEGFDVALLDAAKELGPNTTQIPAQRNLKVYDQVCDTCAFRQDQAPHLKACPTCGGPLRKEVVWQPRKRPTSTNWVFDSELHFQYASNKGQQGDYPEVMSFLGACMFVERQHFLDLGGFDESVGSWGQFAQEWACREWLSGGRVVCNRRTSFSHFFRVGGIGFSYPIKASDQEYARQYARNYWRGNHDPHQIRPLRWLVEKFAPVKGWTQEQIDALPLARSVDRHPHGGMRSGSDSGRVLTRGVVYYTDNRPDALILDAARRTIERSGMPIVAVTLQPIRWPAARHIVLDQERGILTMFRQILAGLDALDTDVVFLCEHDVLYGRSHFQFTLPDRDRVFYNQHVWKVDAESGRALHYLCSQTSGLCADRQLLVEHYRKRVAIVEAQGFTRAMGFEPGTHRRKERVDDLNAETWMSPEPNIDVRHGLTLTPSRWRREQFRNQKYTAGWTEADAVPSWGTTRGRFRELLQEVIGASQQAVA